ncbi:MAG TPA: PspC domain-containing protein [Firmicutes bacterium]|jgi:phage shock protein C|nr:PspC domain-containing protein [Bacillota bacterium]
MKRLYRSRTERKLGGVAGGLAQYFSIDPSLVRLLWVIVGLWAGFGLLAYIIAWIIIPEEPEWDTVDVD